VQKLSALILSLGLLGLAFAQKETPPTQMFTVAQFEEALASAHGLPDKKLAEHIAEVKLTERMSDETFYHISAGLPGPKTRLALLGLADESQFLDLPAAEIPAKPAPDYTTQQALVQKALNYVAKAIPQLPDFIATRHHKLFDGTPLIVSPDLHHALYPLMEDNSRLASNGAGRIDVRYSDGIEVFINPKKKTLTKCDPISGDEMSDFGEILPRVAYEMIKGKVVWSHWELGVDGLLPVFHFEAKLAWNFPHRCKNVADVPRPTLVDFRGEVAINSKDGSFVRVTERLHYDLKAWGRQGVISYIMVEYGLVEIGGQTYICPRKSVGLGFTPALLRPPSVREGTDENLTRGEEIAAERVIDITYTDYHIFRSKSRILPATTPEPSSPVPEPAKANPPAPPSRIAAPSF
jgi:hypothetical protein